MITSIFFSATDRSFLAAECRFVKAMFLFFWPLDVTYGCQIKQCWTGAWLASAVIEYVTYHRQIS